MASPKGIRHPGIHEVAEEDGLTLIEAGYAVEINGEAENEKETAALEPDEKAVASRPGPRKPKVTPVGE